MSTPATVGHSPGAPVDIALAADSGSLPDLLAPWIDQFSTGAYNGATLLNNFASAPFVAQQQLAVNLSGYLQDFVNSPTSSTVTSISNDMQNNLAAVLTGYTLQGATSATTETVVAHTLDGIPGDLNGLGHWFLFTEVPGYLPADEASTITAVIDFLASPASGIIMGDLGPGISPWIALMNSMTAGDDFNTTLANMFGAFFNGATLNLDSVIPAIEA
ncbi:outer membrane porin GjpA, partial [Mycolicibacter icosiumassiliensis]|uniref:outer membrane porin GjpA n=1 Tax=Mycolicibacter icosiumassiliensis TaxID=1792835 RepID=UPI0012B69D26